MSSTLLFYGAFTTGGSGATDLTVTIDVTRITRSDGTQTTSVNGGSATQVTTPNKNGLYLYQLTGADLTLYDYVAVFKTSGTCDLNRIPAAYVPVSADLISILQTVLTETSGGLIAAAFKKFFDKATPTGTINSIPDAVAGAANGLSIVGSQMTSDLTQAVPTSNTAQTLGDCLNAARAQGFGKWTIVGTTLTLYANDGTTAVKTFTLDSATAPTQRV